MAMQAFDVGLDQLTAWTTDDYEIALFATGSFDPGHATVAAITATATEITVSGYTRQLLAGKVRTVDTLLHRITYTADDPDFGTLGAGEDVTAVLLSRVVTNDSDSIPIGWWTASPTPTDAVDPFKVIITDSIVAYTDQAA